jgi:hypothetical protein
MMEETVEPRKSDSPSRTDALAAAAPSTGVELLIGSNIFRNTNGVVKIHGKEQLVVESKPEHGLLLVTLDLYTESGLHIAHVRRNVLALNHEGQFTIDIHRAASSGEVPSVRLLDESGQQVVFEASVVSDSKIRISAGKFYSHKGIPVDITPHYCRIGSDMTRFGDIVEARGGTVVLA